MTDTRYFKRYQGEGVWHYYKLLPQRDPPARELVKLQQPKPLVDFSEYDLHLSSHRALFVVYWSRCEPISVREYEQAYRQATTGEFDLYLNGQLVPSDDR